MMNNNNLKNSLVFIGIGSQIAFTIVVFFFIGRQLDRYFNLTPYLTAFFTLLGCIVAIYSFIKMVVYYTNHKKHNHK